MAVAESVRALAEQGRWLEIRERRVEFLAAAEAAGLARVHSILSTAYFWTAQGPDDWQAAIHHARLATAHAKAGTSLYLYTLHKLAGLLLSTGHLAEAKRLALAFLTQANDRPEFEEHRPYTQYDLSLIAYYQRRLPTAIMYARQAAKGFQIMGNGEQLLRTQCHLAWCYLRMGRPSSAREAMPVQMPESMRHLFEGLEAAILATEGSREDALVLGRRALSGIRKSQDGIDAAEIALFLADVARALRMHSQAQEFLRQAVKYAALQSWDAYALLVLSRRAGGGDPSDSSYASRSGNLRLNDACYTTGVA